MALLSLDGVEISDDDRRALAGGNKPRNRRSRRTGLAPSTVTRWMQTIAM